MRRLSRDGLILCQSLPGATAMQMAAYIGLRVGGVPGALLCYLGFSLPAFSLMLFLSALYATGHGLPAVLAIFQGLQVLVVALVAMAAFTFGRDILKRSSDVFIAAASALLLWSGISPFLVILGAAAAGMALKRGAGSPLPPGEEVLGSLRLPYWLGLFFLLVVVGHTLLFLTSSPLFHLALTLFRIDMFAFGGGFVALPLMHHELVEVRGWLDEKSFIDGIALGQVTPGPIVITATFVGYLLYGVPGAFTATVAIFTPSFLLLVTSVPFFHRLKSSILFARATRGVLPSFVGLLGYMTVNFAVVFPWGSTRVLFALAVLIALVRKVHILYLVAAAAAVSLLLF